MENLLGIRITDKHWKDCAKQRAAAAWMRPLEAAGVPSMPGRALQAA